MSRRGTRSPVERQEPTPQIRMSCKQYARARKALDDMAADHVECCEFTPETPVESLVRKLVPRYVEEPTPCGWKRTDSTGGDHVCVLIADHPGRHSDGELRWSNEIEPAEPKSCGAVNGDAVCSLPLDHHGRHRGDLTSWPA